jgi:adenylate cyclase
MTFKYILPVVKIQSTDPTVAIRQADEFASRALAIDPNYYWAHADKTTVPLAQKRPDATIAELKRSLAVHANFTPAYIPQHSQIIFRPTGEGHTADG